MPPATLLPAGMADHLGRGGTVVTGNQRAARTLRLAFDRQCRADGLASWQPPPILAWDTWTTALYRQLVLDGIATRLLLNRSQELQLWQSVLSDSDATQWRSLQTVASLAALAADAWQSLCAYRGRQRLKDFDATGDTLSFQRWAHTFSRRCQAGAYLSAAELEDSLALAVAAGEVRAPAGGLLCVGFDSRTPAQQALVDALRDSGATVEDQPLAPPTTQAHLFVADDPDAELRHAALWLRSFVAEHPQSRVAVIVPNLAAERREIDRVFRQILAPELNAITAPVSTGPFEFSLGHSLAGAPMVSAAIDILRLAAGSLSIPELSRLLLSPCFAISPSEHPVRAEFDAFELRKSRLLRPEMTLERLIAAGAGARRASGLTGLLSQLRSLHRTALKLLSGTEPKQRPWSEWAESIRELLESAGWAASGRLDSVEFQTRRKWESALDELSTLDFAGTRPAYAEALVAFDGLLGRTLFAPESRDAPVQIMSPREAAGSSFDALWFLRASDLDWPTRTGTNPLLGWRLQRGLAMPGSDTTLDLAHAQRVTERLIGSANTVVFSYARQTAESRQRPSPLLGMFHVEQLALPPEPAAHLPAALETVEDAAFIPLANLNVRGGAGVLKAQAACGFRAFAEKRLWSTPLDTPEPGMDALERGSVVHDALEYLWSELRTQAALRALTPEQRTARISRSIEHSLLRAARLAASDTAAWTPAYLDLQRHRLLRLLAPWLEIELTRPAFEVRLREEEFEAVAIGPLTLSVRIDRVDRLLSEEETSGTVQPREIILDYKTGTAQPKDWSGDRPDEPQLPLYAVLQEPGSVAGVAFANIRAGKDMALLGYEAHAGVLPKTARPVFPTLRAQIEDWNRVLVALAEDFAAGDARVRPKDYPNTCAYCSQRLFCRLDPATLLLDPDDDAVLDEFYE